jgi:hypothetical protein
MLAWGMLSLLVLASGAFAVAPPNAWAHKLPGFPQVRLVGVESDPASPFAQFLTVQVLDPAGRRPVLDAEVTARALHTEFGSALRTGPVLLPPAGEAGLYRGSLIFPGAGGWELTIDVKGLYVGDAHFMVEVAAPAPVAAPGRRQARRPDLPIDWPMLRHLAMEWGHLLGFGLWLGATLFGLVSPDRARWGVVLGTWAAFAVEAVTGVYKMQYSTPFATPLQLFGLSGIPRIFFAQEYVYTLVVKHGLMLAGIGLTVALTVHAWRTKPGGRIRVFRGLLAVNLILALAIAGAAAVLGLYHAIVLHFA